MADPITPDERAAMRERYQKVERPSDPHDEDAWNRYWGDPSPDVLRLLDALDTAEEKNKRQRDRLSAREEQVRRLRAEVTRLHALVADLRAAPVWDEDTVTEAVARAMFPHYFTDDRQPLRVFTETRSDAELWEAERESARHRARQALAVVREHLPVRPDREAVALTLCKEQDSIEHMEQTDDAPCSRCLAWADAVLALWPGESRATVQAEALRDAADAVTEIDGRRDDAAARWLRARADRLEKGETR